MNPQPARNELNVVPINRRAMACLEAAIGYQANPVVRVEAVEALESSGCPEGRPWIRTALTDEHPAVRFAACVAVGRLGDDLAAGALRQRLGDEDASVRVAALFARHRLGHKEGTGRIPTYLLHHEDVTVRRNAALLLGLLDEADAVRVLARAMRDQDTGVRHHALEAMARYGNSEAKQELVFMTNAGIGSEEVFAIGALAATSDPRYLDTFRYKLATGSHIETKLAAARALGRLGSDEGLVIALRAVGAPPRPIRDPDDPPEGQRFRVRQMAAAALGAIGSTRALPALEQLMEDPADPRLQVSGAKAALEILAANRQEGLPFNSTGSGR
jgi:HEAT repeat protein